MDASEDLSQLSVDQLLKERDTAQSMLEDVLDERMFVLGQTGAHLGASKVASLRAAWDRDETRLRERIAALDRALSAAGVDVHG
ncbi:MAG: hypothetical protein EPO21_06985 [Chloroflexota bacterium]|nr:MAG: hypothetical protein EPO21_06985 [Chloroflexota bacterium]